MVTRGHDSSAGTHSNSSNSSSNTAMASTSNSSNDSTMMTNTENTPASSNRDSDIGDSVASCSVSSVSNEVLSSYISDADEEVVSLVPKWTDDGDDSICTSINNNGDDDIENDAESYEFHRIPSTLEFTVLQGKSGGEGEEQPLVSPSSIGYSQHFSHLLRIELTEDYFPSLPIISMPSGPRLENIHFDRDAVVDHIATDITSTFRRRLHTSTDIESTGTNPLSESQSLSLSSSLPLSAPSRCTIFSKKSPRCVLMFGAMFLVMLSVHDNIQNSRQYYRQQYQLLSSDINNRREEIAFPLVHVQVHSDAIGTTGTADGITHKDQENDSVHNQHQPKVELPKFYFPKIDQPNTYWIRGSTSAGRSGNNLAMARSQQPRPIFIPDTPLPDGGFRKPLERFVFDSQERNQKEEQKRSERHVLDKDSSSSWTSWMASLSLIGVLFDTGWKEYRKYRIAVIPSSRDE